MDFKPSECIQKVRQSRPLIHHITNYVTVNDCANICICAGGSPVMSDSSAEAEEIVTASDALVINIGTLSESTLESMIIAGGIASDSRMPIVFDPVGVGVSLFRRTASERIMESCRPSVIKGNWGEMGILSGIGGTVRGVDSGDVSGDMCDIVRKVGKDRDCIAVATGPVDYISDGESVYILSNGTDMEERVSGTGCMLTSVIAAYVASCGVSMESVASAVTVFNAAAEIAAKEAEGPGSFKMKLFDALAGIDPKKVDSMMRIKAS